MDNLLPILLGLLFLGIKYYSKTQKDKAKNLIKGENSTEESSTDSYFFELFNQEKPTAFTEPAYVSNESNEDIENGDIENIEEEENLSWMEQKHQEEPESIEYIGNLSKKPVRDLQFETIQNNGIINAEKLDFDLRKAIIYDAILNPPYL